VLDIGFAERRMISMDLVGYYSMTGQPEDGSHDGSATAEKARCPESVLS
jgi:hypothetical protein